MVRMLASLNPIGRPIADTHAPIVILLEHVAQPAATQRATTLTLPSAMRSHKRVDQITDAHLRDAAEQRGQAVDLRMRRCG
jgi:hypothetical protein